jgi:hypothetical protein
VQAEDEFLMNRWIARAQQGAGARQLGARHDHIEQEQVWVTSTQLEAALGAEEALRLIQRFQEEQEEVRT